MSCDLTPFLKFYDAFGWIPTIRGALSLDLMGMQRQIWGDVDRHAVEFNNFDGLSTERFVVATSLHNVSDSKYGSNYTRTFRYFFYGTIHSKEDGNALLRNLNLDPTDENIQNIVFQDGIMLGHLVIVLEDTNRLTELEVRIINDIKHLSYLKQEYVKDFSVDAVSLEKLQADRAAMKSHWTKIREEIRQLKQENKRQFEFEVFLTRDGILLLKDITCDEYKNAYFTVASASDYTQNVPIHRIFKTAMNFMKFLFHTNYHHEEEHDTFLPASNLHPYLENGNFSRIFKHQIDAFISPLMKMRREHTRLNTIDPVGIMNYAKSFVYACRNNNLVDESEARRQLDYISLLEAENSHSTRHHKSLINSLATQRNTFFILTTILAFAVAVLKIFESSVRISGHDGKILESQPWYYTFLSIVGICLVGYICFEISHHQITKREFHIHKARLRKNQLRTWLFHRDSNLLTGRLSYNLTTYIWIQDKWNDFFHGNKSKIGIQIAKIIFWTIIVVGIISLVLHLLKAL